MALKPAGVGIITALIIGGVTYGVLQYKKSLPNNNSVRIDSTSNVSIKDTLQDTTKQQVTNTVVTTQKNEEPKTELVKKETTVKKVKHEKVKTTKTVKTKKVDNINENEKSNNVIPNF